MPIQLPHSWNYPHEARARSVSVSAMSSFAGFDKEVTHGSIPCTVFVGYGIKRRPPAVPHTATYYYVPYSVQFASPYNVGHNEQNLSN